MNEIILKEENGKVLASSREVAEKFGKRHSDVIRSIKNLIENDSTQNCVQCFRQSIYKDETGKSNKMYMMNRDGFTFLVMGFTGKNANEWKWKYINAFNEMEERLKSGTQLSEEERLKLQLFSKNASEVAYAHNRLVELATTPLKNRNQKLNITIEFLIKTGLSLPLLSPKILVSKVLLN